MNRSKRSLSAMLLLSFLASPVCSAAENLAVMAQPVIQPIHTNTTRNSLQQKVLKPGVRALKANKTQKTKGKKGQENSGGAFASLAKYTIVGGTAFALGARYHDKLKEAADWCMGRNSNKTDPLTGEDDSPVVPADDLPADDSPVVPPSEQELRTQSLVRFARFIGIREGDVYFTIENLKTSLVRNTYEKDFTPPVLERILGPYMNVNDIPDNLRRILISELAITEFLLDNTGYKTRSDYYYLVFPFTLIRIYNLTNVFDALQEYDRNDFTIDIVYNEGSRIYYVTNKRDSMGRPLELEKKHLIDMVFGGRIWEKCTDCRSGSPQFKNKEVDLCVYYPLLKKAWTNPYCSDPNDTPECKFYTAALREDRERYMTRDFVKHPLTLNLLKHVKTLRFDFRTDSFRIVTSNCDTNFVNL